MPDLCKNLQQECSPIAMILPDQKIKTICKPKFTDTSKLHLNKPNTDFMKKSFSYIGQRLHGTSLPCDVVSVHESLSVARFKNLINNYFKNLEDCN